MAFDPLAQGRAAIAGQGVDPSTLYGVPPQATPPVGSWAGNGTGGAPSSPSLPGPTGAPVSAAAPTPMATAMPWHGQVANPGGAGAANAVAVGQNGFGVHPDVNLHQLTDWLLPKVRNVESKGDYQSDRSTTHPGQTASGAYQYIDSTWNKYGGYNRAVDAPQEVQDQKAREDFMGRLKSSGGDPFKAVAGHYFPRYADDPTKWNDPLTDAHGNAIPGAEPVSSYVSKVLPPARVQAYMQAASASGGGGTAPASGTVAASPGASQIPGAGT